MSNSVHEQDIEFNWHKNALAEACEAVRVNSELLSTPSNMQIPKKSDHYLCYVDLLIQKSPTMSVGTIYPITPLGFEHSQREPKDGNIFFGNCKRKTLSTGQKGEIENDIIIRSNKPKISGQHFVIEYNWDDNVYFIRDLGIGFGVFRKLHSYAQVRSNMMASINSNFIVFEVTEDLQNSCLTCEVFTKDKPPLKYSFLSSECFLKNITIGRSRSSEILIEDVGVSKVNSSIMWRNGTWLLIDGDEKSKKYSTNGTWLYIDEKTRLLNGTVLKVGETSFMVKVYNKI